MKETIQPFMVTTSEALSLCIVNHVAAIHICNELYSNDIYTVMTDAGYALWDIPAHNGVFFAKGIDTNQCTISDPCNLF